MEANLSGPLKSLLDTIEQFERGEVAVEALQAAVRSAEDSVTEYELRDLRKFLQSTEGRLDMIRFTVESDHVLAEAMNVARAIRERVRSTFGLTGG